MYKEMIPAERPSSSMVDDFIRFSQKYICCIFLNQLYQAGTCIHMQLQKAFHLKDSCYDRWQTLPRCFTYEDPCCLPCMS